MKKQKVHDEKYVCIFRKKQKEGFKKLMDDIENGYELMYDLNILISKLRIETDQEFEERKRHEHNLKSITNRSKIMNKLYDLPENDYKEIEKQILSKSKTKTIKKTTKKKETKNAKKNNK